MNVATNVLIIDDDADVRRSARVALSSEVGHVELIESPAGIENHLAARSFEVVLLDMNFVSGERNGTAGLNALSRVLAFDATIAVVLMTAYGGVSLAVESLKQGAVDFILKPWRNEKLIAAVHTAAKLAQSRRHAETLQLDALERNAIERALSKHAGNISAAANALGLSRAALYRRMSKHGL